MPPLNYLNWKHSFSKLSKSCHQWELTFLSTIAFRANKILSTVGIDTDFSVDRSFQSFQKLEKFTSWRCCSFQSFQKNTEDATLPVKCLSWQPYFSVWSNGWVFVYELSDCGFDSNCSHLNFRFRVCFEQVVPWHSGNYRVWIHSETGTWHDKNIQP